MAVGPMGVAAPVANSYAAVTLVLSLLVFGVVLSYQAVFALILVIAGAVLLSSDRTLFQGRVLHSKTVKTASVSMLAWGIGFAIINVVVEDNEWHAVLFVISLFMSIFAGILMLARVPMKAREASKLFSLANRSALIAGLLLTTGSVAFYLAASKGGSVVIPAVIASASPLITSAAAYLFDRERLSVVNRFGAVIVVLGIVILNF
jgi:drug/metabolite transporter (DMT)-like permease